MTHLPELKLRHVSARVSPLLLDTHRLREHLALTSPEVDGPSIVNFEPWEGYAGSLVIVAGHGFAPAREGNAVTIGGRTARVVAAEEGRLVVITDHRTRSGPVQVTVNGRTVVGPRDYRVRGWPSPGSEEDGPPFSVYGAGAGTPSAGTIPSTGVARMLVVACHPTDLVPADLAATRQGIVDTFDDVTRFYDQASYGDLDVQVAVTTFVPLLNNADYYHRANGGAGYPNIDAAVLDQLMAECAQGAVDQGLDLDDFEVMVAAVHLPGLGVRAWGGWSSSNFAFDDGAGTSINITTSQPLALIAQSHDADWGRAAHEFAHGLIDGGLVLGEDIYASDLIDPSEATAEQFEMMGNHDSHPMFTGFLMHQLGWYDAANVLDLTWDRNPFSQEVDIVAHGLTEDSEPTRRHLVRVKVSDGLFYFIEVRQRPDPAAATPQIFDENVPLPVSGLDGGVLVTKVISGTINNNHQTRLITLLQENERLMVAGETAVDPIRTLVITVVNDNVQARPRVCRVRIEWAQSVTDTPGGDFDLRIEPWGPGWETRDIWVDRQPFGTFDNTDSSGNPTGNGDAPRPLEINRFEARIRNDGVADAAAVKITHYSVEPPGVGDNGNWAPLRTNTLDVPANGSVVSRANWVPLAGEHTCLKVAISPQLGEVSVGNNQAQENVFQFQPPASSVPAPVLMTVAVRNPLPDRALIRLSLEGLPQGYLGYFPHRWVWLDGHAERKLDLLVVPWMDFRELKVRHADVRLKGYVPRMYDRLLPPSQFPASHFTPIGGVTAQVSPKRKGAVKIENPRVDGTKAVIHGVLQPSIAGQTIRIDATLPNGEVRMTEAKTDQTGRFRALFEIGAKKPKREGERVLAAGPYAFQAHVICATEVAPTESNLAWYHVRPEGDRSIPTPIAKGVPVREDRLSLGADAVAKSPRRKTAAAGSRRGDD